jgi:hypothetical protein
MTALNDSRANIARDYDGQDGYGVFKDAHLPCN